MAVSDPATDVPTPTGTLQGVAAFGWDGSAWQPTGRAGPSIATPTGVLQGVAPFSWDGAAWQPSGRAQPGVATPTGVLDGVAVYAWSGSAWVPAGGQPTPSTPSGALRGVAAFNWDGAAWQPTGQAGPSVTTPYGVLQGVAMFNWTGSTWIAVPAPSLDLSFMSPGALPSGVVFTRASTATYFDVTGTLQTATTNTPRWDYNPSTHVLSGLLIEEARTNLLLNSATLGTQSVTTTAVATTLSFYGTGTVTLSGTSTAGPLTGTGATNRVALTFTPTAGTLTCTVSGSVTNAQLEAGGFATSYIATAGAAATRAAEIMAMPTGAWFNAAAGTLSPEVVYNGSNVNAFPVLASLDDGSTNNYAAMLCKATGLLHCEGTTSGVAQWAIPGPSGPNPGVIRKLGVSMALNNINYDINGVAGTPDLAATLPAATQLHLGCNQLGATGAHSVAFRRVRYWPRALSVAELAAVTT